MASSLYEGLEDVELEKASHRGGSSNAPWMIGHTNGNSTSPLPGSTGIGRLVASATGSTGVSSESTTSLKLMQSHMAARRAQGRRGNFDSSRSSVAPVVDLQRRSGEGTYRFNQMTGKMERVLYPSRSAASSASTALPLGEPSLPLGVADEYNPLIPNDYEELARQRREKRKADERALAAARAAEYNTTGGNAPAGGGFGVGAGAAASGMCRRPVSDSSDSDAEEEDGRRRRRGGGGGRRAGHHHHHSVRGSVSGAAIAPPSSLLEDVVVTPDSSSLAAAASGTTSSSDPTKPEIDDAEVKAIGDKFGINAVAAKMMARMGHRDGQGLGREGQGMSSALVVEKTSRRGGKIIHERDRQRAAAAAAAGQQGGDAPSAEGGVQNAAFSLVAPAHATNVVLLRNMCGPGEVDDDLEPETAEECAKYGKVVTCMIFELPDAAEDEAVRIFVEFEEEQSAVRAVCDLNGRFFGGRVVKAGFYDAEKFRNLELTDAPMQG